MGCPREGVTKGVPRARAEPCARGRPPSAGKVRAGARRRIGVVVAGPRRTGAVVTGSNRAAWCSSPVLRARRSRRIDAATTIAPAPSRFAVLAYGPKRLGERRSRRGAFLDAYRSGGASTFREHRAPRSPTCGLTPAGRGAGITVLVLFDWQTCLLATLRCSAGNFHNGASVASHRS